MSSRSRTLKRGRRRLIRVFSRMNASTSEAVTVKSRRRAREAPESPGVYRFQDARGKDLYVGKARDIRRRVLSYFGRSDQPERTRAMSFR